jgi:hypothetical protein
MDFDEVLRGVTTDPNATKVLESVVESTDYKHLKTALVALLLLLARSLLKDFVTYVVPLITTLLKGKDIQKDA